MLSRRVQGLRPSLIREMNQRRRPTSIDLSLGEPALHPDRDVLDRAFASFVGGETGYTPNAGLPELRAAIARHHGLLGRDQAENVIVTVGSEQALFLGFAATLDPGDEALVPDPGFPAYPQMVRLLSGVPVTYPIDRRTMLPDLAGLAARITPKTRVLLLNSPSNPFGTAFDEAMRDELAALARTHQLTVLSDEVYRDLWYGDRPPASVCDVYSDSLMISGLSKSCAMTGLRLGYLIAPAELVRPSAIAQLLMVTCTSRLGQLAALEVFKDPRRLTAHRPYYAEARRRLLAAAEVMPADAPLFAGEYAFYGIVDVSAYTDDPMALGLELLEREDVVVVPGPGFGDNGGWFWRLSYAGDADKVAEGVRRIARFLRARRGASA